MMCLTKLHKFNVLTPKKSKTISVSVLAFILVYFKKFIRI